MTAVAMQARSRKVKGEGLPLKPRLTRSFLCMRKPAGVSHAADLFDNYEDLKGD